MKSVVITGGTRGIGLGLAREFLKRKHQVTLCGRSDESTQQAIAQLSAEFSADQITGAPCDVSQLDQVENLWDVAYKAYGKVDIWINNAGLGNPMHKLWEQDPNRIETVTNTNLKGVIYGSNVAIKGMIKQGHGQLYNMEGFGSDGGVRDGLTLYGSTKYAVTYITKGLIKETEDLPVHVCYLSPGIVVTDLLMDGYVGSYADLERAKRIFNILGDKVETVTPWLVEEILKNNKHGAKVAWLTTPKIFTRFLTAPFNKRDIFDSN